MVDGSGLGSWWFWRLGNEWCSGLLECEVVWGNEMLGTGHVV